jgi:hypothetical protein
VIDALHGALNQNTNCIGRDFLVAHSLPGIDGSRKLSVESPEPVNLFSEFVQMPFANAGHLSARTFPVLAHLENCCDFFQRKAESLGLANETQTVQVFRTIDSVPGFPSWRLRKQSLPLVKADGLNADSGLPRQISDLHKRHSKPYTRV